MFFHELDPIAFSLGPLNVYWYSLSYILSILISWLIINKILIKYKKNLNDQVINELINYLIIGIILGGRLGYVIFYNLEIYITNPIEILKIWKGGMSFHGGLIGIITSTLIFCKIKKQNFFDLTDLICLVAPIGIFFGRIANFINGELYGRITESSFGIVFSKGGPLPRHPSQLYEAFFEGVVLYFLLNLLFFFTSLKNLTGSMTGLFLILYGFFRIFIEYFREPDKQIGLIFELITMGQILSLPMIIFGIILIKYSFYKFKNG